LDGSGSTDEEGESLTYLWSFISIPAGSTAVLNGADTVKPTFVADKPGTYTVQLVVSNDQESSQPASVLISTQNSFPVANAGPNQTVQTGVTVHLDGSASSDVDGNPLTYLWSFVSAPSGSAAALSNPNAVNPTFVADQKGAYVLQLVVNDGSANSAPVLVTISDVNTPPIANPGPNQTVFSHSLVTLDGSASTDVDGDPLTYAWSILTQPQGSTAALSDPHAVKPSFTTDLFGDYVVQLIVNDGSADSAPATVTITTQNTAPIANAGPAQSVAVGTLVMLNGTASSDVDGQPLTYAWSILSAPALSAAALSASASPSSSFTADKPGNYVIQLIVNDGIVNSAPATITVSTINSVPAANPGQAQIVETGSTVALDGSASTDADGDPLIYTWAILSQPTGGAAVLSNTHAVDPTLVANVAGLYV
ncbi:MAG: PKD domain-containing protein, partial [Candidatus Angelobacter sp.]